jgi:hypothetical protein
LSPKTPPVPLEINPYAPPQHDSAAQWPLLPPDQWPALQFHVVSITGIGLDRRVTLTGAVEAEVHYDGWTPPSETVRVNGMVRGRGNPWDFALVSPQVEFTIDGDDCRPESTFARACRCGRCFG